MSETKKSIEIYKYPLPKKGEYYKESIAKLIARIFFINSVNIQFYFESEVVDNSTDFISLLCTPKKGNVWRCNIFFLPSGRIPDKAEFFQENSPDSEIYKLSLICEGRVRSVFYYRIENRKQELFQSFGIDCSNL